MINKDKILITLSMEPSFRKALKKLLSFNKNLEDIWNNFSLQDFLQANLQEKDFENFQLIKNRGFYEKEIEICQREDIKILYFEDINFPENLKNISDPPRFLFVRGNLKLKNPFAIVGSRKASRYGESITESFSNKLAKSGMTIISGLALGIDSIAHKGALSVHGNTVAILGTAVNDASIYPQTNWTLSQKILKNNGALISEYPPFYQIHKMNFPERNRIISGISDGVLITEAREKSGALITADFALEQGRDVFVVPHDITRTESVGGNNLIKEGAFCVTSPTDIINYYGLSENQENKIELSQNEDKIIKILKLNSCHFNEISKKTGLTIEETSATLSLMEIKGLISNNGNQVFSIKK